MTRRRPPRPRPAKPADDVAARLEAVYAQVPDVECRGQCWDSCGPIGLTPPELQRIRAAGHDVLTGNYFHDGPGMCPSLTMLGRCAVYQLRPMICRVWGVSELLPCPAGCRPEGGLLDDATTRELLAQVAEIGGDHEQAASWRTAPDQVYMAELRRLMDQESVARDLRRRRAEANGTAVYMHGRGRPSLTPPGMIQQ